QTFARQLDEVVVGAGRSGRTGEARRRQVALGVERRELVAEALEDVDVVLRGEIRTADAPQLQLQDELADHLFLDGRTIRAVQRQVARLDTGAVGFPRVHVLHVDAVDVPER